MKILKFCIASLLLMASSAFAVNANFITNAITAYPSTPLGIKYANPANILKVEGDPVTKTIVITYRNGAPAKQWTFASSGDYNYVLDKFFADPRFFVTSNYGTNWHAAIPYAAIGDSECTQADMSTSFYAVKLTLVDGSVVNSNGYSNSQCLNFFN